MTARSPTSQTAEPADPRNSPSFQGTGAGTGSGRAVWVSAVRLPGSSTHSRLRRRRRCSPDTLKSQRGGPRLLLLARPACWRAGDHRLLRCFGCAELLGLRCTAGLHPSGQRSRPSKR